MNVGRVIDKFVAATASFCAVLAVLVFNPVLSSDVQAADYGDPDLNNACRRVLTADVVAFDMPLMWNRFGAQNINGQMFALRRDVVSKGSLQPVGDTLTYADAGNVTLRPDKRPRPLVLRVGAGDCLVYKVTNLLDPNRNPFPDGTGPGTPTTPGQCTNDPTQPLAVRSGVPFNCNIDDQVADRRISLNFQGTELVKSIDDDGSFVGQNNSSLIDVGASKTYFIRGTKEGSYVGTSYGSTFGGEGMNGMMANGLWAVLNVQPVDSAFYRSQVTREEMDLSTLDRTASGHPIIDYETRYDDTPGGTWDLEAKGGLPIMNMVDTTLGSYDGEIVHSDINALIAYGPGFVLDSPAGSNVHAGMIGHFPDNTYPLESVGKRNPSLPNRLEPFREVTVAFHDEVATKQAFPRWFEDPVLGHTLHGVRDSFMINYGSGGIGSEIIASRLRVGPPHDCVNCAYEEFFLTAFTVADVGMLSDVPANFGLEDCVPTLASGCEATGPKATKVLFPDDPSNVHHSYTGEFVKMRNIHAGPGENHVFHQHNHQWLFNPSDDNSNYLDAQGLAPGSGYSYEFVFGGAGNRNKTAGDAIFHCHFYPHFAQGMWEMWRIHDTFEEGTELQASIDNGGIHESFTLNGIGIGDGTPATGARALPDPEIVAGTPIPGVVPVPGKAMAPMPIAGVTVKDNPNTLCVGPAPTYGLQAKLADGSCPVGTNERPKGSLASVPAPDPDDFGQRTAGYPFWVAGIEHTVGQRPPTPPLDMITSDQAAALKASAGGNGLWDHPGFADPASVQGWDGGLPRFAAGGYSEGSEAIVSVLEARLDLSKKVTKVKPYFFPEEGTELEKYAMAYHAVREHDAPIAGQFVNGAPTPSLQMGKFTLNGALPVPGAPYNEPCVDDRGVLMGNTPGRFFDANYGMSVEGMSPYTAMTPRTYKAANVQIDAVFNKLGYHYPQQRIIALWQDVVPSVTKERPPEPLVMRMNTFDCTQYVHSNVVPVAFELDDYQVRTPTDIIGQHIHLPKWDLTTADGAANGWNYEDGTLSPGAVVEMIEAINAYQDDPNYAAVTTDVDGNLVVNSAGTAITDDPSNHLHPLDHPFFGNTPYAAEWKGARSTLQRWFADPVVNVQGVDRGLGIIFSHDHYGPSTHQQVGLYSTVLIEPAGSEWRHNETGDKMYTRTGTDPGADGGPTSWQAAILTGGDSSEFGSYSQNVGAGQVESHREFYFEYSDFQHAYQPGVYIGADAEGLPLEHYVFTDSGIQIGGPGQTANGTLLAGQGLLGPDPDSFRDSIQPSFRQQAQPTADGSNSFDEEFSDFPTDIWVFPDYCPGTTFNADGSVANLVPRPCPEAISADDPGMYVVNYRNESLAARVFDPDRNDCPDESGTVDEHGGCQAKGEAGDLAYAMSSFTTRKIPELNDAIGNAPLGYFDNDNLCANGIDCPPINQLGKGGVEDLDPFTPMLRAYEGDRIHVKIQAGAHEEEHSVSIHGMKWLQAGSGFGEAKNSGWRNAQPAGISEQFSFRMPVIADQNQTGNVGDYAYNINASLDGWVNGTWGVVRTIRNGGSKGKGGTSSNNAELFSLPGNDGGAVQLPRGMNGVCPADAPTRAYDITAVLAEDVLPGIGIDIQDPYPNSHEGRSPEGPGTLVYNSRRSIVAGTVEARGSDGLSVLHDPTAILYVMTDDLIADDPGYTGSGANLVPNDPRCWRMEKKAKYDPSLPTCPVQLKPGTPIEPLVVRANAGDCIEVTVRNKLLQQATTADQYAYPIVNDLGKPVYEDEGESKHLDKGLNADTNGDGIGDYAVAHADVGFDSMPDLATGNSIVAIMRRDANAKAGPGGSRTGMTTFQSNLMAPSACVGLHPTLVEYDVTRSDGTAVGTNLPSQEILCPNQTVRNTYQWYAGHINPVLVGTSKQGKRQFEFETTPIEFGGFNIMAADKVEQGQKGLVGAGVIYPAGATWTVDSDTNMEATVTVDGKTFRDFVTVTQKGASMFYEDSFPVENLLGQGSFGVAEDAQDMGQMAINYSNEPLWFRFGLNPTDEHGFLLVSNSGDAYSNSLAGNEDPQTAVFNVAAGQEFRQHILMPFGSGRGSLYNLHGHSWQRDPYICEGSADLGLPGKCLTGNGHAGTSDTGEVGSQALGINPIGMELGGIESWFPSEHFEIFIPSAGGINGVTGDYLFRDHVGLGNADGLWGIIRVE